MQNTRFRVAATVGAVTLGASTLVALPAALPAADAAAVDGVVVVDSITVTSASGADQLHVWDQVDVAFLFDTTGRQVAPGDTFTVGFPAAFKPATGTFPVKDSDTGAVVADCTTAASGAPGAAVTCAFTDYAATHHDIKGRVSSHVQISEAISSESVTFVVDGKATKPVDLPGEGGVVGGTTPAVHSLVKQGWVLNDDPNTVYWQVVIPGSDQRLAGKDVRLTDTIADDLAAPQVIYLQRTLNVDGWAEKDTWEDVTDGHAEVSGRTVTGFIPKRAFDDRYVYRLSYYTPILQADDRDFSNSVDVSGVSATSNVRKETTGTGDADGQTPTPKPTPTPTPTTVTVTTTTPVPTTITTTQDVPTTVTTTKEVPTTITTTSPVPTTITTTEHVPTTITTTEQVPTTVSTTVTTTAPQPAIQIVKKDVDGNDADVVPVDLTGPGVGLTMHITNTGPEALRDLVVTDASNGGTVTGLNCTFPGGATGTTWAGPLAVGAGFDCTAALDGVAPGGTHTDLATVTGVGVTSGTKVGDDNPYNARRPQTSPTSGTNPTPVPPAGTGSLDLGSIGGGSGSVPLFLGSAALGSLGLAGICWGALPLPEWVLRMLPPFCPAAPKTAVVTTPPVAPGPVVPNGRG